TRPKYKVLLNKSLLRNISSRDQVISSEHCKKDTSRDSMIKRRSCSLTLLATCALLAASAHISFGQSDLASVNGVVRDPSGAVIPEAKITLRNEATAVEVKTRTSAAGNYSIPSVPAGT